MDVIRPSLQSTLAPVISAAGLSLQRIWRVHSASRASGTGTGCRRQQHLRPWPRKNQNTLTALSLEPAYQTANFAFSLGGRGRPIRPFRAGPAAPARHTLGWA